MTTVSGAAAEPGWFNPVGNCPYGASCMFVHDVDSPCTFAPRTLVTHIPTPQLQPNYTPSFSARPFPAASKPTTYSRSPKGPWHHVNQSAAPFMKDAEGWYSGEPEEVSAAVQQARAAARERRRLAQEKIAAEQEAQRAAEEVARKAREAEEEAVRRGREAEEGAARKAREADEEAARQVHVARLAQRNKEEAAATVQAEMLGSIVTFGAGLDIRGFLSGFESCNLRFKDIPLHVDRDSVHSYLTQQGFTPDRFQIIALRRTLYETQYAEIIAERQRARALTQMKYLERVEIGVHNIPGSMAASPIPAVGVDLLTISWAAPSVSYVAEYAGLPQAEMKALELDRSLYRGRRIKAQMNIKGRSSVTITNLPVTVDDVHALELAGSVAVRRLEETSYDVEPGIQHLRQQIERFGAGNMKSFQQLSSGNSPDGMVSVCAQFPSWEEAHMVLLAIANERYPFLGNTPMLLRLPSPMHYTISFPIEQYQAQMPQWDALVRSAHVQAGCCLSVEEHGAMASVRLWGSAKRAIGALKVRIERLASGEKVEVWHHTFGTQGSTFARTVQESTGAFVRVDRRKRVLKIFGEPRAVERARAFIKTELDRLSSSEYATILPKRSLSFFIRHGIPALKETFGEDSVQLVLPARKVTVTGGEDARHNLRRLIDESLALVPSHPSEIDAGDISCPVCYDNVSVPVKLGCGHSYCTACLHHYLVSAEDSGQYPIVCVGDEARCGVLIPIPTVSKFLPTTSFNHLLETVFSTYVAKHPKELQYCTTADCTQIYRVSNRDSPAVVQCPSCFRTACTACGEDGHEGKTCEEQERMRADHLNDLWIANQGGRVKRCPACRVPIEKLEGCYHMSCRCGVHICWRCMGTFTAKDINRHMWQAHGTIRDGDPNPPPVANVEVQRALLRQVEERRHQAEEARRRQEEELRRQVEEQGRQAEEVRRRQEEQQRQVEEARRRQEEEQRHHAEETRRRQEEERQRRAEEARQRQEEEQQRQAEETRRRREDERRRQEEQQQQRQAEAMRWRLEAQRQRREEEHRRQAEEERRRQEERLRAEEKERRRQIFRFSLTIVFLSPAFSSGLVLLHKAPLPLPPPSGLVSVCILAIGFHAVMLVLLAGLRQQYGGSCTIM